MAAAGKGVVGGEVGDGTLTSQREGRQAGRQALPRRRRRTHCSAPPRRDTRTGGAGPTLAHPVPLLTWDGRHTSQREDRQAGREAGTPAVATGASGGDAAAAAAAVGQADADLDGGGGGAGGDAVLGSGDIISPELLALLPRRADVDLARRMPLQRESTTAGFRGHQEEVCTAQWPLNALETRISNSMG
ncbi:hypothetical protein PLESTB_001939600 [Pleodorina starrii]|uniref:Uncharacterized protein n=1 Tax=Pleodorina starrii TaxID=330485 RepID=A0A9W6FAY6_9CHLO|nr:hypothetical protein PLESTB_001939600 [Pleodorina starrii]